LCERDIAIAHFTLGGWFYGLTRGHNLTNVFTRIEQFATASDPVATLVHARLFIYGKIRNQRTLLMRNHLDAPRSALRELKYASAAALAANDLQSLLGVEGAAARLYFQHFSGMIKSSKESPSEADQDSTQREFTFRLDQRNRRPPRDPVNAMLSLGYALLARECSVSAWSTGFDPYVGFLHQPRYGRPSLALDLMEEFRPLVVDSTVLTLINNRMIEPGDFIRAGNTVTLSQRGRKAFINAYGVTVRAELTDINQVPEETARLYQLLQDSVDRESQHPGWLPGEAGAGNGNGHSNGNGHTWESGRSNSRAASWACSPKQRDLILKITDEHQVDMNDIEELAQERFDKSVTALNRMEASGLIDELLETYGKKRGNGRRTQAGGRR